MELKFNNKSINVYTNEIDCNKKNIIFLHGFSSSHMSYSTIIKNLKSEYNIFCPNMPGNGITLSTSDDELNIVYYAEVLAALVKQYKIEDFVLIGHSMGTAVIASFFLNHQELVSKVIKIILISPNGWDITKKQEEDVKKHFDVSTKEEYRELVKNLVVNSEEIMKTRIFSMIENLELNHLISNRKTLRPLMESLFDKQLLKTNVYPGYVAMNGKKVLVIVGDSDVITGFQNAIDTAKITGGQIEVIKNIGHVPSWECPKVLNEKINKFLN